MFHAFSNPGYLKIQGENAIKFLQGQLTCDVQNLPPHDWQLAAHCNPQGRIISLFWLRQGSDDTFYLLMEQAMLAIASAALKKYAIFYPLSITTGSDPEVTGPSLPVKKYSSAIPIIYPATSGKFLPNELGLDKLGAINFSKGCYTGQEIIARLHYRGKLKSQVYQVTSSQLLDPGADIIDEQHCARGIVVNACTCHDRHLALVILSDGKMPLYSGSHTLLNSEPVHVN